MSEYFTPKFPSYYKILFLLSFPFVREYYQTPFKRPIAQL